MGPYCTGEPPASAMVPPLHAFLRQKCIPVRCVPSIAVVIGRGGLSAQGGVWGCLAGGVCPRECLPEDVCPGGCLPWRSLPGRVVCPEGVSAQGGVSRRYIPACTGQGVSTKVHAGIHTPTPMDKILVKTLPFCNYFIRNADHPWC